MGYDTWNADGNMKICTTGIIFIKASFLCVSEKAKVEQKERQET